jgi:predicted N-acetyltransferase YhbS
MIIRKEQPEDFKAVASIIKAAFAKDPHSDQREHIIVEKLRQSENFISELSLVAEKDSEVVGHILLTPISIVNENEEIPSLALAPVSVKVELQGEGIGGLLIEKAHEKARALSFKHIVLLGHEDYYPRFGYELTSKYNIQLPFPAPEVNCMVKALEANALDNVHGMVVYPKAFSE